MQATAPSDTCRVFILPAVSDGAYNTIMRQPKLADVTEDLLREITQRIVEAIHPVCVVLFGSRARGDARPDSDVDLLVVDERPFGDDHDRFEELGRLFRALRGLLVAKDVLLFSRDEIERWRHSDYHVIGTAMKEGRVLYGRA